MKNKILITLTIALVFALTTCDNTTDHTHTWSDWQSNAEQHWKECSCGEKTDIGNYTGNPCTVCGYEAPTEQQPKIIDNTNGLDFTGKVTIKTSDLYTVADWDAVVQKVIAALNRGYDNGAGGNDVIFDDVFNNGERRGFEIEVIVLKSASHNVEVKRGEYGKLYLKEASLDTVNVKDAVWVMSDGLNGVDIGEYQANAAPPKHRAFLALERGGVPDVEIA